MIHRQAVAVAVQAVDADGNLPGMQKLAFTGLQVRRKTPAAEVATQERSIDNHVTRPGRGTLPVEPFKFVTVRPPAIGISAITHSPCPDPLWAPAKSPGVFFNPCAPAAPESASSGRFRAAGTG